MEAEKLLKGAVVLPSQNEQSDIGKKHTLVRTDIYFSLPQPFPPPCPQLPPSEIEVYVKEQYMEMDRMLWWTGLWSPPLQV